MKYKDLLQKQYLAKNIVAPAFYVAGYKKIAEHINDCSTFKRYSVCSDCGQIYFNGSYLCHERFCPICNKKRSMIYFYRFVPVIKKLLSRGYYVNMLNFTLVDDSNLQHSLDVLTKAFRYIQHDSKEYRKMFNSMFVGGVSSKEIKLGENSKLWHPHIHCIVIKDHYSEDFEYLKLIWNNSVRLAGGNASATDPTKYGSVYISSIVDRASHLSDKQSSIEVGVLETMKYITKFDYQLDSALIPELVKSLKNVRTVNTWVCFAIYLMVLKTICLSHTVSFIKTVALCVVATTFMIFVARTRLEMSQILIWIKHCLLKSLKCCLAITTLFLWSSLKKIWLLAKLMVALFMANDKLITKTIISK